MNRFIKKYNQYKQKYLISEGTIKSLASLVQNDLLINHYGVLSYDELSDEQKEELPFFLESSLDEIKYKVENITLNKQYQSWVYDILKRENKNIFEDFEVIKDCIADFEKLCKRPDLTSDQRNIQNYKTFYDLQRFVLNFQQNHKLSGNIWENIFEKLYKNQSYTLYKVNENQYEDLNLMCGGVTDKYFNTGWCVAKNKDYFEDYLNGLGDYYILWISNKDNKPFALLHYASDQFKDTSDEPLTNTDDKDILDGLNYCQPNLIKYKYEDLKIFTIPLYLFQNPGQSIGNYIAEKFELKYDNKNKILDCCGNQFKFEDQWLDQNGTFDFTIINATNDWSGMFSECGLLTQLPQNFTIPEGVTNCNQMFYDCQSLRCLPDNFTLPSTLKYCKRMFYKCYSLTHLPEQFTIPNKVDSTYSMFNTCIDLTHLPDDFIIPQNVRIADFMFYGCCRLQQLPDNFKILNKDCKCYHMFSECEELTKLPKNFKIPTKHQRLKDINPDYGFIKMFCNTHVKWDPSFVDHGEENE